MRIFLREAARFFVWVLLIIGAATLLNTDAAHLAAWMALALALDRSRENRRP
jgi:hypothetical protein